MAIAYTEKGTDDDKSSGLTLAVNSVQLDASSAPVALLAYLAYDDGDGHPVVEWGQQDLMPRQRTSGNGLTLAMYKMVKKRGDNTNACIATWDTTAPTAKTMILIEAAEATKIDRKGGNAQAAETDPGSGKEQNTTFDDELFIAAFASEGPPSDTRGTFQNGFTAGQRVGTSGAPPISNITLDTGYKIVTAKETTRARKTGATERDHVTLLTMLYDPTAQSILIGLWECSTCGFQSDIKSDFRDDEGNIACPICGDTF
jgi:rubrerythrin